MDLSLKALGTQLDPNSDAAQDVYRSVEDTLHVSEERFRLLVENAPDAIVMYDSEQGRFIDANAQAERLFGCAREEILKHGPAHFYAANQPDGRPVGETIAEHNTRAQAGEQLSYERWVRRPNGEERICQVTMVSLPTTHGRLLRGSFVDITERKQSEQRLARTNRALRTLSHANEVVVRSDTEADLLEQMCRVIVETGGYRMAWIGEVEHDPSKTVKLIAYTGEGSGRLVKELRLSWDDVPAGRGTTGRAVRTRQPQISQEFLSDPSMAPWAALAKQYGIASAATFPLQDHSDVFAILLIYANEPSAFDVDEVKLLQELADDLSYGINALRRRVEHAALEQRWRSSLEATVGAIANTVEMRDPYTSGHQQRVARLAVAMARMLGISEHAVQGIYLASIVHDVGKINVPAEILNKPGRLSKAELSLIQDHAEAGYNILKGIDFPWPIAQMVRQHHERLDGSGYPLGIRGDAILAEAKILAVADVVDAMTSHRPYRPALAIDVALEEIDQNRERLYESAVVDACLTLFREKGFTFGDS